MRALRRHVRLVQPNSDMTLIRRPQKKKPPRRRLFNTGRCGVGQGFSHVYSRPTQPLQDSQRDRRNERPRSHHRVRLRRLRRSRARLRSLCTRRARFIREHPTCPSIFCEATLGRVAKRKKAPAHDAVIPARTHGRRRWTMDDETRRYCVLTFPLALKFFLVSYPESCRFRIYRA
jgi:hypothetical protein